MKENLVDYFLSNTHDILIKLDSGGSKNIKLGPKFRAINKRGITINYASLLLFEDELELLVKAAYDKLPTNYIKHVNDEFNFLTGQKTDYHTLAYFKENHPFGKKESMYLLQQYKKLYRGFANVVAHNIVTSKNIISTNATTCITTLQLHDRILHVYQRSCDMSCGFLADALTIDLFRQLTGAQAVKGFIACPHIYNNNFDETKKYFEDYNYKKRKFKLNVR